MATTTTAAPETRTDKTERAPRPTTHVQDATDTLLFRRYAVAGLTGHRRDRAIAKQLRKLAGFRYVAVDIAAGIITVQTTRELTRAEVAVAIEKAGYELVSLGATSN